ncbi:nucleoside triphosphate hydrolase [Aestuariivirga litoralis]|uniref:nucleoside triphosphate hydrolase n=1 Tax=Aestuariivirga litoralis TaxID=2650924 RepID=UPI0018C6B0CC|nr:nucleoside triphosphate hydrolase [Aestuariivirga litoralis]MBG1233802.1 nucleoside triphosphate hydrolase [Aestuariivirga litoralis]
MDISELASSLQQRAGGAARYMVGIAGAPGSGKSTLAEHLRDALKAKGESAVVVPMDGFHFDDAVLNARGHRARKGAPYTFDVAGFEVLLKRIKAREPDIAIPVFDRKVELSRAAADIINGDDKFIVVEGNYLLLDQPGWAGLKPLFDYTVFLNVPEAELERRLMARWHGFGFSDEKATAWIASNDMPNIRTVLNESAAADLTV